MHSSYFELYRMGINRYFLRQKLVAYAHEYGIKMAATRSARLANSPRQLASLQEQPRLPRHCPHQIDAVLEQHIIQRRQIEFELLCNANTVARVLRQHHLTRYGIKDAALIWQTDNGDEFLEHAQGQGLPGVVRSHGTDHRYIPPRHCT